MENKEQKVIKFTQQEITAIVNELAKMPYAQVFQIVSFVEKIVEKNIKEENSENV